MVYALVDRLADILEVEGSTEPLTNAGRPRSGSSPNQDGLEMLLRHAGDGTRHRQPATGRHPGSGRATPTTRRSLPAVADDAFEAGLTDSRHRQPDPDAEPPAWTAEDYDEPDDPAPVDHPDVPDYWQQRLRPRPTPEPPAPVWHREPDDPDPPDDLELPGTSGLRLDLPGLADLLTQQGLGLPAPGSCSTCT